MNFATIAQPTNTNQNKAYFGQTNKSVALLMITILFTFFLSSCAKTDTIAPVESQPTAQAREAVSLLNADTFEQSQLASFWYIELRASNAGNMVSSIARAGKQAMRFGWSPSQYDGSNNSCHAELATAMLTQQENERWYGFSMYMPAENMANDGQVVNLTQWHAYPEEGYEGTVPPINIELKPNNELSFVYRASNVAITKHLQLPTSQKNMSLGTASFDRWVDFVVHVKWDATGQQGVVQLWQDGQLKVNEQNVSVGYVKARNFWKIGLYCYTGKATHAERVVYFDEVRIGNASGNYDAVKPGRQDGSAKAQVSTK